MTTDFSSYTHKFRATGDAFQQNGPGKVSKRNRQPLSCLPCRTRKLKCDRGHPCEACNKRNDEASCTYGKTPQPGKADSAQRGKAQDRLRQLEQLVMQMVDSNDQDSTTPASQTTSSVNEIVDKDGTPKDGRLETSPSTSKYVGSTHWSAILENIQELRNAIGDEQAKSPEREEADDIDSPDQEVLFGSRTTYTLQHVLAQNLPPKIQVDRKLSTYFNAKYMVIPYIHTYQFQRQYEQFWLDPLNTSPLWVSILFSICFLSSKLNQVVGSETSTPEDQVVEPSLLLVAAARCLVLGGYTRPKPFVVEALSLYAQCKYSSTLDPSGEVGIIFSVLVRLAYRMGYHRDPDNFPNKFSVFEGEMRRRVWAMCKQFDLMVSFQLGLPNNVIVDSSDTKPPRNLLDSDFNEDAIQLPPSRPETEPTQILYFIVKSRLMHNFGRVCTHSLSFKSSSEEEVMALDNEIRQTYSTVPEPLYIRPMSQSLADPSYLIMVRLNCEFLYQKSLCVLHRKYMTQGHEYSTKACLDAATAIVERFSDIHREFQRGGQLFNDRWMLSSFTMNDFLLAAMILCFAVSNWKKRNPGRSINEDVVATRHLAMVRKCHTICIERAHTSTESRKVAQALGVMLSQFQPSKLRQDFGLSSNTLGPTLSNASGTSVPGYSSGTYDINLSPLSLHETPPRRPSGTTMPGLSNSTLSPSSKSISSPQQYPPGPSYVPFHLANPLNRNVPQPLSLMDINSNPYAANFNSAATSSPTSNLNSGITDPNFDFDMSMNLDNVDMDLPIDLGPFETFVDGGNENIDWTFLDQYLVNPDGYGEFQGGFGGSDFQFPSLTGGNDGRGGGGGVIGNVFNTNQGGDGNMASPSPGLFSSPSSRQGQNQTQGGNLASSPSQQRRTQ